jgi:FKBP-type peptidyl-prolyl cis-trans isomerase (trigger factor)
MLALGCDHGGYPLMKEVIDYLEKNGIEFKNFVTVYYDMTEEEFYDWVQEQAEAIVKEDMISYAIARAENITLTEEEYVERATEYAIEQYELASLEAFELLYEKNVIRETLLFDKVRELIAEKANRIDMAGIGDTN